MKSYPLAKPYIGKTEERYVLEVLHSNILSMGPKVEEFEKKFARYTGAKYACAVSSGTAGLHLALIVAGITEGDEVITTPFSFVASANAILYVRAKPVFADIDPVTYNIDPKKIEEKITKKTKALLIVHIFGQAADMDPIMRLARKHRLKVIEDACESVGAVYGKGIKRGKGAKPNSVDSVALGRPHGLARSAESGFRGKMVGSFGESAVFAFYPNKQLTTGEGGMIVTNDAKKDALFRSLRNQGRAADMQWLTHERLGYNYRLDEMSAALGLAQLERIDFLIRERQKIANQYHALLLRHSDAIQPLTVSSRNTNTWFVYPILLSRGISRGKVMARMAKQGISTKPYLPSIHLFDFYKKRFGFKKGDFPISEEVSARVLALPFYIGLTKSDMTHICEVLLSVLPHCNEEHI